MHKKYRQQRSKDGLQSQSSQSQSYNQSYYSQRESSLQQVISLNVTIFNDLGFNVTSDHFVQKQAFEEESQQQNSDSQLSQFDYGDQDYYEDPYERNIDDQQMSSQIYYYGQMRDESNFDDSNYQSPFFPQISRQGLSLEEITSLPTMLWRQTHNIFNRGEKCPVCLEQFQLGNTLRVMNCLHRYHIDCLDEWLRLKASCPSCRNMPNRQDQ